MSKIELPEQILWTPIPDQRPAMQLRLQGYDDIPADPNHHLYNNPLVPLSEYGINAVSYYARKNNTGDQFRAFHPMY